VTGGQDEEGNLEEGVWQMYCLLLITFLNINHFLKDLFDQVAVKGRADQANYAARE